MQAYAWQKLPGSSFEGGHLSCLPEYFNVNRLNMADGQVLRWRGFDTHMPACLPVKCILHVYRSLVEDSGKYFLYLVKQLTMNAGDPCNNIA
jgi:hypothetical protein